MRYDDDSDYGDTLERREVFADPGEKSALRASGKGNRRNKRCPTCGRANALTPRDVALGYQCNRCADMEERGW